jgi:hypothetical protein
MRDLNGNFFSFLLQSENGDTSRQGILKRSGSTYSVQSNSTPPSSTFTDELKMSKEKVCVYVKNLPVSVILYCKMKRSTAD